MYTPDEMELIHREVMRLRAGGKPEPITEPPEVSPEEDRRASIIALSIIVVPIAFVLFMLFFFWEEREQMLSILRGLVYCVLGVLGIISLIFFVKSKISKDLEDRVCFNALFVQSFSIVAFILLIVTTSGAIYDSFQKELKAQVSVEEKAK